jgi:hypothetical protein
MGRLEMSPLVSRESCKIYATTFAAGRTETASLSAALVFLWGIPTSPAGGKGPDVPCPTDCKLASVLVAALPTDTVGAFLMFV